MFNHVMLGSNDLERSREFYDRVLAILGCTTGPSLSTTNSGHHRLFYRHEGQTLGISQPINDQPATAGNGSTVAFRCNSPEQVRAFHDIAIAHGGHSIEDPPGPRTLGPYSYFLAYVRDPDGNKLCAIHRLPNEPTAE